MPTVAMIHYEHLLQNLRDQMWNFQHSRVEFKAVLNLAQTWLKAPQTGQVIE